VCGPVYLQVNGRNDISFDQGMLLDLQYMMNGPSGLSFKITDRPCGVERERRCLNQRAKFSMRLLFTSRGR
jgi:hypothetical protein